MVAAEYEQTVRPYHAETFPWQREKAHAWRVMTGSPLRAIDEAAAASQVEVVDVTVIGVNKRSGDVEAKITYRVTVP